MRASARLELDPETRAWTALATNLLVLPGLGSLLVGRREGWLQLALALAGVVPTLVWLISFFEAWAQLGAFPLEGGPDLRLGIVGLALFAAAWLWSLASSLAAIRQARP